MGAAAFVADTIDANDEIFDEEFDGEAHGDQSEAESDLRQVVEYLFETHLERVATLGNIFRRYRIESGKAPGGTLPAREVIEKMIQDPLVQVMLDMPAKLATGNKMVTLGQMLQEAEQIHGDNEVSWLDLVQNFKSSRVNSTFRLPRMRAVFNLIDVDNSGSVDKHELLAAMKREPGIAAFLALPAKINKIESVDSSAESKSTETTDAGAQKDESEVLQTFAEIFDLIDEDQSNDITWEEFAKFFVWK